MSDHEFERQVRKQMDEMKLSPSASVWQGVEADLDKSKRRRRGLIYAPLLLLLLAGGVYFFTANIFSGSPNNQELAGTPATRTEEASAEKDIKDPTSSLSEAEPAKPNEQVSKIRERELADNRPPEAVDKAASSTKKNSSTLNNTPRQELYTPADKKRTSNKTYSNKSRQAQFGKREQKVGKRRGQALPVDGGFQLPASDELVVTPLPKKGSENNVDASAEIQGKAGSSVNNEQNATTVNSKRKADSTAFSIAAIIKKQEVQLARKKKSKWQFGVTGSGGLANIKEGAVFEFKQAAVSDVSATAPQGNVAPAFGFIYKPAVIKPEFSYSVSVFAQRPLTKRLSVSIGLGYSQFNTSANIGRRIDSSRIVNNGSRGYSNVSIYYTPEQSYEYDMYYRFIDVPVNVQYRINNSRQLPLHINVGVVGSKLLSTNALHFDGTSGVYYRNDDLFNKLHLSAVTGLSVGLFNRSKFPISAGPVVRYQVSRMLQKDVSTSNHLISFGAELKMLLKK